MSTSPAQLAEHVQEARRASGVPGVAVGLVRADEQHVIVAGTADVDDPVEIDRATVFEIGSTTKTITATAVMRLVDTGDLALDVPIRTWLPQLQLADEEAAAQLTLAHVLTHTGGFEGDLWFDPGNGDDALALFVDRLPQLRQFAPPGQLWSYSNAGYSLVGRVLEVVTGGTFEVAIRELVLDPLGMHRTGPSTEDVGPPAVVGHTVRDGHARRLDPAPPPRALGPAGGLVSSVEDQLTYARFHVGDGTAPSGERLLRTGSMREMRRAHVRAGGGRASSMGLGWLIQEGRDVPLFAHGGSTNGQESGFVVVPDADLAVTVLTNADAGAALQRSLVKAVLHEELGPSTRPDVDPLPPDRLEEFVGVYEDTSHTITVGREGHGLTVQFTPTVGLRRAFPAVPETDRMPLVVTADDGVRVTAGPYHGAHGEFIRDTNGQVAFLRIDGQARPRTRAGDDGQPPAERAGPV